MPCTVSNTIALIKCCDIEAIKQRVLFFRCSFESIQPVFNSVATLEEAAESDSLILRLDSVQGKLYRVAWEIGT